MSNLYPEAELPFSKQMNAENTVTEPQVTGPSSSIILDSDCGPAQIPTPGPPPPCAPERTCDPVCSPNSPCHPKEPCAICVPEFGEENLDPGPTPLRFLWLELTGKCNLRCIHCYADSGPYRRLHDEMVPEDWENVLEQAADLGCRAVQFIGGEPTMYPALARLIERARELGFTFVEVYTNGTMLNPRLKETFLRHHVHLAFSVYSASPQIHDRVTQQDGSLESTLASIRWALASGLGVRAGIIEMDANAGETERTRELLEAMGVSKIGVDRIRGIGRGGSPRPVESQLHELCGACTSGKATVNSTGEIFPCPMSRFWVVGRVRDGLRAAVDGMPMRTFRERMKEAFPIRQRSHDGSGLDPAASIGCDPDVCEPKITPCAICVPDFQDPCEPDFGQDRDIGTRKSRLATTAEGVRP